MKLTRPLTALALVYLGGCSETAPNEVPSPGTSASQASLLVLASCEDVESALRAAAARAMNELIDRKIEQAQGALDQGYCWINEYTDEGGVVVPAPSAGGGPRAETPSDVSETNNQVAGVDEADFVKNDDRYVYAIRQGALQIVEAWPPENARVIARVELDDSPKRILVEGDRLLVFSSVARSPEVTATYDPWYYGNQSECTYGYDCDFTGDGQKTRIGIYDISDRSAPALLRTIDVSASFLSARRIGTSVHTVLYEEPEFLRTLPVVPETLEGGRLCTGVSSSGAQVPAPGDAERMLNEFEALKALNRAAIEAVPIEELRGSFSDTSPLATNPLESCSGYYDSPLADGTAFLHLMSFDLGSDAPVRQSTIVSRPGASYASKDAYYISVRQQPTYGWFTGLDAVEEASTVHKFALQGASNRFAASGVVAGRVLNQFSMDEYEGHLRIATTQGHVPSPDVRSALSVLRQNGAALELTGRIDDIAPTEDIRSVRFVGDKGYIVTFKKTDPLFVFDLADPTQPRTEGELKIPGFSTYMHPFAEGHLLTIGYDAADQGDFAYFTGLLLQVFDVRDPANPLLAHKVVIGTRGTSSEAATNHLAFNYFAARDTLAIPITECEGGGTDGQYADTMTFSGLQLYQVTAEGGFTLTGEVPHPYVDPSDSSTYYVGGACSNWWTQASSTVERTIFMDDFVYSVSDLRMKVNDLRDLSYDVADVSF